MYAQYMVQVVLRVFHNAADLSLVMSLVTVMSFFITVHLWHCLEGQTSCSKEDTRCVQTNSVSRRTGSFKVYLRTAQYVAAVCVHVCLLLGCVGVWRFRFSCWAVLECGVFRFSCWAVLECGVFRFSCWAVLECGVFRFSCWAVLVCGVFYFGMSD